jgi:CBS domain containing-hemolysin-like protein
VRGETVEAAGHRFTVTALDGHRVARVHISPTGPADDPS